MKLLSVKLSPLNRFSWLMLPKPLPIAIAFELFWFPTPYVALLFVFNGFTSSGFHQTRLLCFLLKWSAQSDLCPFVLKFPPPPIRASIPYKWKPGRHFGEDRSLNVTLLTLLLSFFSQSLQIPCLFPFLFYLPTRTRRTTPSYPVGTCRTIYFLETKLKKSLAISLQWAASNKRIDSLVGHLHR